MARLPLYDFAQRYGVLYPFVGAGMAFADSTTALAIAVCKAGGIGTLAVGLIPAAALRERIREIKQATDRPFNINFITFLAKEEQLQVCIEENVPIVSFHWGRPPVHMLLSLREAGIKVWEQVGSVEDACRAATDGMDVIIVQGLEAGGPNFATLPTFVLVPMVVEAVWPTPVLAAGGITTGTQVAAALCLGASGVWVGTRLLASYEAYIHPDYKERLVSSSGTDTCLTSIFGPEWRHFNPMRVLKNGVALSNTGREDEVPAARSNEGVNGKTMWISEEIELQRFSSFLPMPSTESNLEEIPLLAGQGVGLITNIQSVSDIVAGMMKEARKANHYVFQVAEKWQVE
ncbi:MAG TPA: nitronate monooxygenase [Flavisolibacter sp.]|jgi:NAD(P)H-dependent flavin oxidoreductase YrpB (nitropropane dioxygenase family)|nr:nitronate monooxygenase [Flavisolibacter sp.]